MVKAVLLDLDGTLFDRDAAVRALFAAQHAAFAGELGGVGADDFVRRMIELDEHGHADKRAMYLQLVRELGLSDALGVQLLANYRAIYPRFGALFPDALATLAELRGRGLRLGVVSNGLVESQQGKLDRLALAPLLDVTLISEREGLRKPDVRLFARALERLGVSPSDAWHVGDHPVADVAGARAAGLTAVWRYVPYWPEPATRDFTIHSLAELLPLLERAG